MIKEKENYRNRRQLQSEEQHIEQLRRRRENDRNHQQLENDE